MTNQIRLSAEEDHVLSVLSDHTWDETVALTGWSKGRIYRLALRAGARKTEQRIRLRKADRDALQLAAFRELLGHSTTSDVLDLLAAIPSNSIDLYVTSIPYNLGVPYGDCASADQMPFLYYLGWCIQIISEIKRTLKVGGTAFLQMGVTKDDEGERYPIDYMLFPFLREAGLTFQNRVIWHLTQGVPTSRRLVGIHETALVFSNGPTQTFNPNAARTPQRQPGKRSYRAHNYGQLTGHPLGAAPTDVWDLPTVRHGHPEKTDHPAQFPEAVAMRAALLWTLPGQVICDPFVGSGTTEVVCVRSGRTFIGGDLFYEAPRTARVAAATPDASTPLSGVTDESLAIWQAEARRIDVPARPVTTAHEQQLAFEYTGAAAA